MHTPLIDTRPLGLTPQQYSRLVDEAKREALRLRREALREWASAVADWFRSRLQWPRPSRWEV